MRIGQSTRDQDKNFHLLSDNVSVISQTKFDNSYFNTNPLAPGEIFYHPTVFPEQTSLFTKETTGSPVASLDKNGLKLEKIAGEEILYKKENNVIFNKDQDFSFFIDAHLLTDDTEPSLCMKVANLERLIIVGYVGDEIGFVDNTGQFISSYTFSTNEKAIKIGVLREGTDVHLVYGNSIILTEFYDNFHSTNEEYVAFGLQQSLEADAAYIKEVAFSSAMLQVYLDGYHSDGMKYNKYGESVVEQKDFVKYDDTFKEGGEDFWTKEVSGSGSVTFLSNKITMQTNGEAGTAELMAKLAITKRLGLKHKIHLSSLRDGGTYQFGFRRLDFDIELVIEFTNDADTITYRIVNYTSGTPTELVAPQVVSFDHTIEVEKYEDNFKFILNGTTVYDDTQPTENCTVFHKLILADPFESSSVQLMEPEQLYGHYYYGYHDFVDDFKVPKHTLWDFQKEVPGTMKFESDGCQLQIPGSQGSLIFDSQIGLNRFYNFHLNCNFKDINCSGDSGIFLLIYDEFKADRYIKIGRDGTGNYRLEINDGGTITTESQISNDTAGQFQIRYLFGKLHAAVYDDTDGYHAFTPKNLEFFRHPKVKIFLYSDNPAVSAQVKVENIKLYYGNLALYKASWANDISKKYYSGIKSSKYTDNVLDFENEINITGNSGYILPQNGSIYLGIMGDNWRSLDYKYKLQGRLSMVFDLEAIKSITSALLYLSIGFKNNAGGEYKLLYYEDNANLTLTFAHPGGSNYISIAGDRRLKLKLERISGKMTAYIFDEDDNLFEKLGEGECFGELRPFISLQSISTVEWFDGEIKNLTISGKHVPALSAFDEEMPVNPVCVGTDAGVDILDTHGNKLLSVKKENETDPNSYVALFDPNNVQDSIWAIQDIKHSLFGSIFISSQLSLLYVIDLNKDRIFLIADGKLQMFNGLIQDRQEEFGYSDTGITGLEITNTVWEFDVATPGPNEILAVSTDLGVYCVFNRLVKTDPDSSVRGTIKPIFDRDFNLCVVSTGKFKRFNFGKYQENNFTEDDSATIIGV
jgi:hypothetical protein